MQRALDRVAFHEAVGKRRIGVRADAVGGVDFIADAKQRDGCPVDVDTEHLAGAQRVERRHLLPCHAEHSVRSSRPCSLLSIPHFPLLAIIFRPSSWLDREMLIQQPTTHADAVAFGNSSAYRHIVAT
jgi:hypothetical protein